MRHSGWIGSMVVARNGRTAPTDEEVEIGALVGLPVIASLLTRPRSLILAREPSLAAKTFHLTHPLISEGYVRP